jgi:hypothetical protein
MHLSEHRGLGRQNCAKHREQICPSASALTATREKFCLWEALRERRNLEADALTQLSRLHKNVQSAKTLLESNIADRDPRFP